MSKKRSQRKIIILTVGLFVGALLVFAPACKKSDTPAKPQPQSQGKKTMYRSTMNPNEISDKPGKDSMGMEMVPFEVEESRPSAVEGKAIVRISPERQQLIGVRIGTVELKPIRKIIRTYSRVDYAEPSVGFVTLKFDGWVDALYADKTGQVVKKGEPLLDLYSPDLVAAQKEYLLAVKAQGISVPNAAALVSSAKERLRLWDITDAQVEELGRTGEVRKNLTVYSPLSGFVIEKNVLRGQKVAAGESLYKIADLSRVWIVGEVYDYELPFVKLQQEVSVSLSYYPGETFKGPITFIYPFINAETRTNKIRAEVNNPGYKLKPEMFAGMEITADYGQRLVVPSDAVLEAGVKSVVFVDKSEGYFEPREVKLGIKGDGVYEVLSGLAAGEKVVTSANFLIDSESSLKAALERMARASAPGKTKS